MYDVYCSIFKIKPKQKTHANNGLYQSHRTIRTSILLKLKTKYTEHVTFYWERMLLRHAYQLCIVNKNDQTAMIYKHYFESFNTFIKSVLLSSADF